MDIIGSVGKEVFQVASLTVVGKISYPPVFGIHKPITSNPVDTRRRFNVYKTPIRRRRRRVFTSIGLIVNI